MKEKKYYVNNQDLLDKIKDYKDSDKFSDELGKMIFDIAKNYACKGNFSGYTWKEDMVSEAVLTCCKYLKNFDADKSNNAFAYITKICHNSFKGYIKKENKHSKIKDILYNGFVEYELIYEEKSIDYTEFKNEI